MTDYGLGKLPKPDDDRDWPIEALYAMRGLEAAVPPASYVTPPPLYPILDQGLTPQCVAYSGAGEQGWYDLRDQGLFNFEEAAFFSAIGGTANGAIVRDAFKYRLATGYPAAGSPAALHRIAAYYAVPLDKVSIQQAIMAFGPVVIGTPWYDSWFSPVAGVLPPPTTLAGGHALLAVGWDARGLRLRNSWGTGWGIGGEAYLPWAYLGKIDEAWKAVDVIEAPPVGATYTVHIAAKAPVLTANFTGSCISSWSKRTWGPKASSAPCQAPRIVRGCVSGSATLVRVTKGTFAGKDLRVGPGVTVTKN